MTELLIPRMYVALLDEGATAKSEITFANMDDYNTLSIDSVTVSGYYSYFSIYGDGNSLYSGFDRNTSNILIDISNYSTIQFKWSKITYTDETSAALTFTNIRFK